MKKRESASEIVAEQEYPSPLYPERPSEQARAVVLRQEFQTAIHDRLTQALYGDQRSLPDVVLSSAPGKPLKLDRYINAEVLAEEEAIEIDRFVRYYVQSSNPSPDTIKETINATLASGALRPATHEQIEREEKWRRHLLAFAAAFRQRDFKHAEEIVKELSIESKKEDGEMVADQFRGIIAPLIDSALDTCLIEMKYQNIQETFYLASLCDFIPKEHFTQKVQLAVKNLDARKEFGCELLRDIDTPRYNLLIEMWNAYGVTEDAITKIVRAGTDSYIKNRSFKNGQVDMKKFEEALDILKGHGVFSEQDYRKQYLELLVGLTKNEMLNHTKSGNEVEKIFLDFQKEAVQKGLCKAKDFAHNPVLRKAAEVMLVNSFVGGQYVRGRLLGVGQQSISSLLTTASRIAKLGIMGYNEALNCEPILKLATENLVKIFSDNGASPKIRESIYIQAVTSYLNAGIGTRRDFDNIPEVKKARNAIEQQNNN
ncbi:MAG: hypothetical protein Q8P56_04635 [Candidatus Uhrbacteria bacterium]|nr:hypothetical protein [Candidatus Uhrbacteria bacterium]